MSVLSKKRFLFVSLTFLCTLLSLVRLYREGDVPILTLTVGRFIPNVFDNYWHATADKSHANAMLWQRSRELHGQWNSTQQCECACHSSSSSDIREDKDVVTRRIPYIAPGPSKVQELIPLDVLKKHLTLKKLDGLQYLDHTSLSHFYQCSPSTNPLLPTHNANDKQCHKRKFLMQRKPLTALVSFHGSGNTWVRHLLEQTTGVYTGSIYCDNALKVFFPGEFVISGNVIVVKTHHADTRQLPKDVQLETGQQLYDRAIVVIRNPFDALVSEANRRWNSNRSVNDHLGLADETTFIGNSKWDWYVEYKSVAWAYLIHTWLSQIDTKIIVIQYERLVQNIHQELKKILSFLDVDVNDEDISCAVENSGGVFKRSTHLNFEPYSRANKDAVNRCIAQAGPLLAKHGIVYEQR